MIYTSGWAVNRVGWWCYLLLENEKMSNFSSLSLSLFPHHDARETNSLSNFYGLSLVNHLEISISSPSHSPFSSRCFLRRKVNKCLCFFLLIYKSADPLLLGRRRHSPVALRKKGKTFPFHQLRLSASASSRRVSQYWFYAEERESKRAGRRPAVELTQCVYVKT